MSETEYRPSPDHRIEHERLAGPSLLTAGKTTMLVVPENTGPHRRGDTSGIHFFDVSGLGYHVTHDDPEITIGSASNNTQTITDEYVSKQHAGIRRSPDGWYVDDLRSTNGTFMEPVARVAATGEPVAVRNNRWEFIAPDERDIVSVVIDGREAQLYERGSDKYLRNGTQDHPLGLFHRTGIASGEATELEDADVIIVPTHEGYLIRNRRPGVRTEITLMPPRVGGNSKDEQQQGPRPQEYERLVSKGSKLTVGIAAARSFIEKARKLDRDIAKPPVIAFPEGEQPAAEEAHESAESINGFVQWDHRSEAGTQHDNQDTVVSGKNAVAVFDGVSEGNLGAIASGKAEETMHEILDGLGDDPTVEQVDAALEDFWAQVNTRISLEQEQLVRKFGVKTRTTGAIGIIGRNQHGEKIVSTLNSGDSSLLVIKKDGSVVQITKEDSNLNLRDASRGLDSAQGKYNDLIKSLKRLQGQQSKEAFIKAHNIPYQALFEHLREEADIDALGIRALWNNKSTIHHAIDGESAMPRIGHYTVDENNDLMILAVTDGISDPFTNKMKQLSKLMRQRHIPLGKRLEQVIQQAHSEQGLWRKDDDASIAAGVLQQAA